MDYSVCVPAVFNGMLITEALKCIREAGYNHYEIWSWWDKDLDLLYRVQHELHLRLTALCTRFIPLTDPNQRTAYLEGLRESVDASRKLGSDIIITQVGQEIQGVPRKQQHQNIIDGLKACLPILEKYGCKLLIEPLNTKIDHPGYFLWQSEEAFEITDAVGSPLVQILYDVYHQHIMGEDTIQEISRNTEGIGHIHIAGHPGRHEPHINNEIDFGAVIKALKASGYKQKVGLEYIPLGTPIEGLREIKERLSQRIIL